MKRTKKGHGPGKGKVSLSCTIPEEIDRELRRLATSSGKTRSGYAKRAVMQAVARGEQYIEQTISKHVYPFEHPENPTARAAEPPENETPPDVGNVGT
jgi:predicted DNA-binding protein